MIFATLLFGFNEAPIHESGKFDDLGLIPLDGLELQ